MTRGRPAAVVASVGSVTGLAAIRSLGRMGVDVVAVGDAPSAIGFHSRYARPVLAPAPADDEEGFVRVLEEVGDSLAEPAPVLPTSDAALCAVARHRERLGDRFLYSMPAWSELRRLQDKSHQLEKAAAAGIDTPRTRREPTTEYGFPVLVKPTHGVGFRRAFGTQAFVCRDPEGMLAAFERAGPFDPLVQEWIPGGDDQLYQFASYLDDDSRPLGQFGCRKLRQTRAGVGTCRVGRAYWSDELAETSLRLARALGLRGLFEVEFKRDARDRRLKLMEVNPRLWQWHGLAMACGVDFPRLAYEDMTGARPQPRPIYRGARCWSITVLIGSGEDDGEHPLRPAVPAMRYVDAVFAADDLGPSAFQARQVARALALRLHPGRPLRER